MLLKKTKRFPHFLLNFVCSEPHYVLGELGFPPGLQALRFWWCLPEVTVLLWRKLGVLDVTATEPSPSVVLLRKFPFYKGLAVGAEDDHE